MSTFRYCWLGLLALVLSGGIVGGQAIAPVPPIAPVAQSSAATKVPGDWLVDQDIRVTLVAGPERVRFPMFATLDDRGALYVAESSGLDLYAELKKRSEGCRISVLEDSDWDGTFDQSRVYVDKLVFPMGLVWRPEGLYVADPPYLVLYPDANQDGVADERQILLTGFGHEDNGSLHGLTFGPDGWLYLTMGEPDGYQLHQPNGEVLAGKNGALIRFHPQTRQVEVVSRGFVNLVELEFTPSGERLGTDNWFQLPDQGIRDALVHLVPGGLYPLKPHVDKTRHLETGELLPAAAMLPVLGISGIARPRGLALRPAWQHDYFTAQHNTRSVQRHHVEYHGSTLQATQEFFAQAQDPNVHPSDVLESPLGGLLVVDTGAWYVQHCPTGKIQAGPALGGIYWFQSRDIKRQDDSMGTQVAWPKLSFAQAAELLNDPRPVVQTRAERALETMAGPLSPAVIGWISDHPQVAADEHVARLIWVLKRRGELTGSSTTLKTLLHLTAARNSEVPRLALLQVCGEEPASALREDFENLLLHDHLAVRRLAADALARNGSAQSVRLLLDALKTTEEPHLRHALIRAVGMLATPEQLQTIVNQGTGTSCVVGLILLNQREGLLTVQHLGTALQSQDGSVRLTAVDILRNHPEFHALATQELTRLLRLDAWTVADERSASDLLRAFHQQPDMAAALQKVLSAIPPADGDRQEPVRSERMVWVLTQLYGLPLAQWQDALLPAVQQTLQSKLPEVRAAAVKLAGSARMELSMDVRTHLRGVLNTESLATSDELAILKVLLQTEANSVGGTAEAELVERALNILQNAEGALDRFAAAELLVHFNGSEAQTCALLHAAEGEPLLAVALLKPVLLRVRPGPTSEAALRLLQTRMAAGAYPETAVLEHVVHQLDATLQPEGASLLAQQAAVQDQQVQQLQAWLQKANHGDATRGEAVFRGTAAGCAVCHQVSGQGGKVGPDLTGIGVYRAPRDLFESIAFPSSTIAQGYQTFTVTTTEGAVLTGLVKSQGMGTLRITDLARQETLLPENSVESMIPSQQSLMPEGLVQRITEQELLDLVAWLQSLRQPTPGSHKASQD